MPDMRTPCAKKRQTSRLIRFHPIGSSIPPFRPSVPAAHSLTRPSNVCRPKFQRIPRTENTIFPFDFCRRPLQYSVSHTSANTPPSLCYKTSRVVRELCTSIVYRLYCFFIYFLFHENTRRKRYSFCYSLTKPPKTNWRRRRKYKRQTHTNCSLTCLRKN